MKKLLQYLFLVGITTSLNAQLVSDSVSLGTSGANQVWYSLENGEVGSAPLNEWHIGFYIPSLFSSELFINDAAGNALSVYPGEYADWETFDTTGYSTWQVLNNGYDIWKGAFSYTGSGAHPDYGWGSYDMNSHNLYGSRIFVLKIGTAFKKLRIDQLLSTQGEYTMTVANLDGTEEKKIVFNKNEATGKLLGYVNILTGEILDREPAIAEWDLVFTKYWDLVSGMRYGVTGVLQNEGVAVATATPIDRPDEYKDTTGLVFSEAINTIGYDWKAYVFAEGKYVIEDSTVYFVKAKTGEYWRVIMTGYASAGTIQSFKKEKLAVTTGIIDQKNQISLSLNVYPNPTANRQFTVAYDIEKSVNNLTLDVLDISGRVVYTQSLAPKNGLSTQLVSVPQLSSGLYLVRVSQNGNGVTQKISIQ